METDGQSSGDDRPRWTEARARKRQGDAGARRTPRARALPTTNTRAHLGAQPCDAHDSVRQRLRDTAGHLVEPLARELTARRASIAVALLAFGDEDFELLREHDERLARVGRERRWVWRKRRELALAAVLGPARSQLIHLRQLSARQALARAREQLPNRDQEGTRRRGE